MTIQHLPTGSFSPQLKRAFHSILQFVPDPVRNERVNIAVLLESPEYGFRGAKYLRYMHTRLKAIDPNVDDQLIYALAQRIEQDFKSGGKGFEEQPIDFGPSIKAEHLQKLKFSLDAGDRNLWFLSSPQPLLLPQSQRFEDRLNALYRRFVERPDAPKQKTFDKEYTRQTAIKNLERHDVILDTSPNPLGGEVFEENFFDAAYVKKSSTYLQFLSYDLQNPDLDQLRLFLATVEDVRKGGKFISENRYYYMTILQPPSHHKSESNWLVYKKALSHLDRYHIPAFKPDGRQIEAVADALSHSADPSQYPNLLNS